MKKSTSIILCILLAISLLANVGILYRYSTNTDTTNSIIGTYCTGEQEDADYIVFQDDGKYFQYRQFEDAIQGTWEVDHQNKSLFSLTTSDGSTAHVILCEKSCYLAKEDAVSYYTKLSETPTFINTTHN